jgi:hypothetical protein
MDHIQSPPDSPRGTKCSTPVGVSGWITALRASLYRANTYVQAIHGPDAAIVDWRIPRRNIDDQSQ